MLTVFLILKAVVCNGGIANFDRDIKALVNLTNHKVPRMSLDQFSCDYKMGGLRLPFTIV